MREEHQVTTEHEAPAVGEAETKLRLAFAECLVDEDGVPPADPVGSRRGESGGWDSVTHLQLVARIEDLFGVEFDIDDIVDFETYGDGVNILRKLGVEVGV